MLVKEKEMDLTAEKIQSYIIEKLNLEQDNLIQQWAKSAKEETTRYFVLDDVLPDDLFQKISNNFPKELSNFEQRDSFRERKKTLAKIYALPKIIEQALYAFQDKKIIQKISQITGIDSLEADPGLYAGGVSAMAKGDFLNPHIDNSHDASRSRYRRLNLLYYTSTDWCSENGGNFELWDIKVKRATEIVCKANRLVIMDTNATSWHSVNPVKIDRIRGCLSNYFFSKTSPNNKNYYHITAFSARPEQWITRTWCALDNVMRQFIASKLGISRGKNLVNDKPAS